MTLWLCCDVSERELTSCLNLMLHSVCHSMLILDGKDNEYE